MANCQHANFMRVNRAVSGNLGIRCSQTDLAKTTTEVCASEVVESSMAQATRFPCTRLLVSIYNWNNGAGGFRLF